MDQPLQSERRKQVRLKRRPDLIVVEERYEGKNYHVVKDPVSLKYYRLDDQHFFVYQKFDGLHTLEQIQKDFEQRFRPDRLKLEDLEAFARQLVTSGIVQYESPNAGKQLFEKRGKQRALKRLATFTNILYIKIPLFDPDRLLNWLYGYTRWIFTNTFLFISVAFMLAAAALVLFKFEVFYDKLPAYHEFFRFRTLLYMWISLGVVKVIHEFGHGLSCKAFGGECHQMGALIMCFSPSLYCNVTDAWTLANKWQRILISFAGIYVELMIAAAATFVWWYTPHWPFVNNIALCLMTLCSISTFMFNANPLMRFDGYYILADWLEVPNLREKCNRFLGSLAAEKCLGVEKTPQPYMAPWRKWFFAIYAVTSWIYRWVITFSIVLFMTTWLKPYNMESIGYMLAIGSLATMIGWPIYRLIRNTMQRGRLPDMKRTRVLITCSVLVLIVATFFFVPLPINRVLETGVVRVQEGHVLNITIPEVGGFLVEQYVQDGDIVREGQDLAVFSNPKQAAKVAQLDREVDFLKKQRSVLQSQMAKAPPDPNLLAHYQGELYEINGKLKAAEESLRGEKLALDELKVLRAKRGGLIMGAPKKEEMFKEWDKAESPPFCRIGDPTKLRVIVPVTPPEYREIRESLERRSAENPSAAFLEASILLSNRSDHIFQGRVTTVPNTHESNVPVELTSKGGGPIAVRPGNNPHVNEPVAQTYLVQVEILDPDRSIVPGSQAKVKIHLRWKTAASWVGQKIASALDWPLW
jgi:putative peptide zinc metalloprotease protein